MHFFLKYIFLIVAFTFSAFAADTPGQQLSNKLGTGNNPHLLLYLSANGPNWGKFAIDYGTSGNAPWSSNPSINWSSWDVKDTDQNYYGTITLKSDGNSIQWDNYVGGSGGYYLDGIHLDPIGNNTYQLTVDKIYPQGGGGPFPDAPLATPMVYPGTSQPIVLSVQGNQIVNDRGDSILIKGLVRPSLEWSATGQYLSVQDLSNIANWKSSGVVADSNAIRLDLYQGFWLNSQPVTAQGSYKQIINAIVYYATQLGMAVILDLHWTNAGYQSPMANLDSITFWTQVASDYKDFGTVMFELYNEPYGITPQVWLNGDSTYAGFQQLYNAVRGQGANNICIIGGLDYAYDLSFVGPSFKVNGTNIVYCSHPYNNKGEPGYTGPGGTFDQNYQGIFLGNFPLIFTEFGVNQASYFPTGYEPIYTSILNYANSHNIHYTGFAWWVEEGDPQFPALIQDWDGTALYGGIDVHNDMVNHPPTPLPGSTVTFLEIRAISDIFQTTTLFDASDFNGKRYCWNFGDGSSTCTSTAKTSHNYATTGSYVVSLSVIQGNETTKTSRTIKVGANKIPIQTFTVCPPKHLQGKQTISKKGTIKNKLKWDGSQSTDCLPATDFLVLDTKKKKLVAKVIFNKTNTYQTEIKTNKKGKTTYAIIAIDRNGNRSQAKTITIGEK